MKHEVIPDAFQLHTELDGIAYTLLGISNQLEGNDGSKLSEDGLIQALYSVQEHIFRISEDWMIHTEHLEQRVEELSVSQPTGKTADQEGQQGKGEPLS